MKIVAFVSALNMDLSYKYVPSEAVFFNSEEILG